MIFFHFSVQAYFLDFVVGFIKMNSSLFAQSSIINLVMLSCRFSKLSIKLGDGTTVEVLADAAMQERLMKGGKEKSLNQIMTQIRLNPNMPEYLDMGIFWIIKLLKITKELGINWENISRRIRRSYISMCIEETRTTKTLHAKPGLEISWSRELRTPSNFCRVQRCKGLYMHLLMPIGSSCRCNWAPWKKYT